MLRTQRKRNKETENLVDISSANEKLQEEEEDTSKHKKNLYHQEFRRIVVLMALLMSITAILFKPSANVQSIGYRIKIQRSEFVLFVDLRDQTVTLVTKCDPKQNYGGTLYLWLEGDALVYIPLYQKKQKEWSVWNQWHGTMDLPLEQGQYQLKSLWTGCKDEFEYPEEDTLLPWTTFERMDKGSSSSTTIRSNNNDTSYHTMFPQSQWIQWNIWKDLVETKQHAEPPASSLLPKDKDYVWIDPQAKTLSLIEQDNTSLFLFKESSLKSETEFYEFHKLSNYELVCWIGSASARDSHSAFLSLRPHLFPHQRPFKFHLYPSYNFDQPDQTWGDDTSHNGLKQKFRKCKHILVSLDEPETPLSQCEYKEKVTTFIHHLETAFPDLTFPIWIFTTLESPLHTHNCHSECMYLPRSTNHPCNDVLKDLFASSPFSSRVQLLDNTDISSAMTIMNKSMLQLQYLVALRIFVIVGKKVKEWRMVQQEGRIDGLYRGNHVEPNFDLIAYDWRGSWKDVKNELHAER